MFAGFLVVLFVEAPDQLFEDGAHAVVVETGVDDVPIGVLHRFWAQVDGGRGEFLDEHPERVATREPWDLVPELEVLEDVLDVRGESVEVGLEIGSKLLAVRAVSEVPQGELGGVVEGLARSLAKRRVLLDHPCGVECRLHVEDSLLRIFKDRIEPSKHGHGQNDVPVLATDVEISEDVVGDPPDVVRDPAGIAVS